MAKQPTRRAAAPETPATPPVVEDAVEEITEEKPILNFEGETYVIEDLDLETQELLATLQAIIPQLTEAQNTVRILEKARESFILELRDLLGVEDDLEDQQFLTTKKKGGLCPLFYWSYPLRVRARTFECEASAFTYSSAARTRPFITVGLPLDGTE